MLVPFFIPPLNSSMNELYENLYYMITKLDQLKYDLMFLYLTESCEPTSRINCT